MVKCTESREYCAFYVRVGWIARNRDGKFFFRGISPMCSFAVRLAESMFIFLSTLCSFSLFVLTILVSKIKHSHGGGKESSWGSICSRLQNMLVLCSPLRIQMKRRALLLNCGELFQWLCTVLVCRGGVKLKKELTNNWEFFQNLNFSYILLAPTRSWMDSEIVIKLTRKMVKRNLSTFLGRFDLFF